ncbi:MAG: HD domain-containing protein [Deltaproteobacteria bacterium]|nr:HD domain-containing protein [Deltaproteobacteria bacterium]
MLAQSRILVVGNDPDILQQIGQVVQPLGCLALHVIGIEELRQRLADLAPDLVILDGDSSLCRETDLRQGVVDCLRRSATRPQVLLMSRVDDIEREALWQASQADDLIDKPLEQLDLHVRVRSLVRVHRLTTQVTRDRDVLNALFELSTFSSDFQSPDAVLLALTKRVVEWTGLHHVAVTLGSPGQARTAAETHHRPGNRGQSFLDRRHAELCSRGDIWSIDEAEGVLAGESSGSLPYIGIPLKTQSGEILGALHAWGGGPLPSGQHMRVLRVAAERISTEIQLHESKRRLEEMVEARTSDLTAALERLRTVNTQLIEASRDTVMRLARAAEYRDGDTGEHVERMSSYSAAIAKQMGIPPEEQALLKLAAPMHDVGKIGIRDSILLKQGRLTAEEWDVMRQHPTIGAQILGGSRSRLLQMAEEIAASHHERWDGEGYPARKQGETIPLYGRIVALADVFDALTTPRVYKDAWSVEDAVAHIRRESGKQFDPRIVEAFEQCLHRLLEIRAQFVDSPAG